MNEIQIFRNKEFGEVRTVVIEGEPWFVGKDVAEALGYKDTADALKRHVDDDDKLTRCFTDSGQSREMYVINESGVYALVFGSKLPNAKKFKRWVTSEVLPAIRKTGGYSLPMTTAEQIQLLAKGNVELNEKIEFVNRDLQDFKREMPLLAIECQQITEAKNKKIVPLLGGKEANAYRNASLRGRVYRDLEGQLRREFGVTSYKAIHRNEADKALEIIGAYELPLCLRNEVEFENAQMCM